MERNHVIIIHADSLIGWSGYAWKDGEYVDDLQGHFHQVISNPVSRVKIDEVPLQDLILELAKRGQCSFTKETVKELLTFVEEANEEDDQDKMLIEKLAIALKYVEGVS